MSELSEDFRAMREHSKAFKHDQQESEKGIFELAEQFFNL